MRIPAKRLLTYAGLVILAGLVAGGVIVLKHDKSTSFIGQAFLGQPAPEANPAPAAPPPFDKSQYSLSLPTSPWLIVNKHRPLQPADFVPQLVAPDVPLRLAATNPEMQVSSQMTVALQQLFTAAKQDGLELMVASGYRSHQSQASIYNREVARNGQAQADRESARPGHSEHQTGLAVDIGPASRKCEIQVCFGELPEGKWLAANAHAYGFIVRYAQGSEAVTGYSYEPWHLRYVGTSLATEIFTEGNPPLETYFELGAAPTYR